LAVPGDPTRHYIDDNLALLEATGLKGADPDREMRYSVKPETLAKISSWISEWGGRPLLCICPVSSQKQKCWSLSGWIHLSDYLLARGYGLVFGGAPRERGYIEKIRSGLSSPGETRNVANVFTFQEFAALLALSKGLITLDSAPLHLAGALKVPAVVFFSSYYDPRKLAPLNIPLLAFYSDASVPRKDLGWFSGTMSFEMKKVISELSGFLEKNNSFGGRN
jgi:ADP-heptose:LPS heptosyltransferase